MFILGIDAEKPSKVQVLSNDHFLGMGGVDLNAFIQDIWLAPYFIWFCINYALL